MLDTPTLLQTPVPNPQPPFLLQLVHASVSLIQRCLYSSAEIGSSAEAVKELLPSGLDARLQQLLATVRLSRRVGVGHVPPGVWGFTLRALGEQGPRRPPSAHFHTLTIARAP